MGRSLVIVESPAKAKTINKYLGREFVVKSSVGHIRDLPVSGGEASKERGAKRGKTKAAADDKTPAVSPLVRRMGVDPEHGWQARYEILPGKEKVVDELRHLAAEADTIYLATDLDREGEAIAWHLMQAIGGDPARYRRVVFNEITQRAIRDAFDSPGTLDLNRVNAQQARRFLDRVVGYMLSPLLWSKITRGLSAGRVQSVAVKLVVEREREIRAFLPEEYWTLDAELLGKGHTPVWFQVAKEGDKKFQPGDEATTRKAMAALQGAEFILRQREDKPTQSRPGAPFITSTLQQAASTRLGFGVKKTMTLAQRLYEAGHITYMRTDSSNLSAEAVASCRELIKSEFGATYLPPQPQGYASRSGAQEAHEAIRPTDVRAKPGKIAGLEPDQQRLYELIWRQFVACQMAPAHFTSTTLVVDAGDHELRARGRVMLFDGFLKVLPAPAKSEDDRELPDLKKGARLDLQQLKPAQHFTKPPARYSEATLVRELEKRGIGRPSTYAAIISTIQERGYVRLDQRRFHAEKMGELVTDRLAECFTQLMDYGFTAQLEQQLDEVAAGQVEWKAVLDTFYDDFSSKLRLAERPQGGMRGNQPTATDIPCPRCARPMLIRSGKTGIFLGCSGFALPAAEQCKETLNLLPGEEAILADADDEAESRQLRARHRCPLCGTAMESYLVDASQKLHVCGNNPDCAGYEIERGSYKLKGYDGPSIACDKCGESMQLKSGRFGKFFACAAAGCSNTRKLLKSGQAAPPKSAPIPMPELRCTKVNDHYVLRDGAAGLFLAASQFPKHRETRAPRVRELLPHADQLDPKYVHLLSAPLTDDQGNDTFIRFSRKEGALYLSSEADDKATGWQARYQHGKWVASSGQKRDSAKSAPATRKKRKVA